MWKGGNYTPPQYTLVTDLMLRITYDTNFPKLHNKLP